MGNASFEKGIKSSIKQEFESLHQSKQRDYLTVSEIIKFQPPEHYPFSFDHLGNLFVLNSTRSGTFTVEELYQFSEFCQKNLKNVKTYEFQSQLQSATTQVLLHHLQKENGENEIVDWIEAMLLKNEKNPTTFERTGNTKFIRIQTVNILYEIFKVKLMNGMEIQSFFYLLQQCGEEAGLMSLDAKELDEYAPAEMGKEFARQYLRGFAKLMKEIGFQEEQQQNYIQFNQLQQHQQQQQQQQSQSQSTTLLGPDMRLQQFEQEEQKEQYKYQNHSMEIEDEEEEDEDEDEDEDEEEYYFEDDNLQNTAGGGGQQIFYQSQQQQQQQQQSTPQKNKINKQLQGIPNKIQDINLLNKANTLNFNQQQQQQLQEMNPIQNIPLMTENKVVIPPLKFNANISKGSQKNTYE